MPAILDRWNFSGQIKEILKQNSGWRLGGRESGVCIYLKFKIGNMQFYLLVGNRAEGEVKSISSVLDIVLDD